MLYKSTTTSCMRWSFNDVAICKHETIMMKWRDMLCLDLSLKMIFGQYSLKQK